MFPMENDTKAKQQIKGKQSQCIGNACDTKAHHPKNKKRHTHTIFSLISLHDVGIFRYIFQHYAIFNASRMSKEFNIYAIYV